MHRINLIESHFWPLSAYNHQPKTLPIVTSLFCCLTITEEEQLHYLVHNAGVMMCDFNKTEDGHEQQFQVNYLCKPHFLF